MSGIYGIVRYDGAPVTVETLAPMAAAMAFWGPDGHGQWCGGGGGLGHLMLHVTPESLHERLPASIRVAPHLVITADARIDNRDELFNALGVPGPGRDQTPDSSLILLAYERWGPDCVKQLLGDFAFAIWDGRERKLFCARDHFGCKPFVYHHDGKRFVFASDIKGVLARVESPRLNEPLLALYLQMGTHHAQKRLTFFEEIVKLPPAHSLTLTAGGVQLYRYWSPQDAPEVRLATDADYADQMRLLFQEAVECRLRSAFPICSHLSGGLDSSSVSVVAARILRARGQQLEVFSWSPPPEPGTSTDAGSELARIEAVCRQECLSCQYVPTTKASFLEWFQRDITVEPVAMLAREAGVQAKAEVQGLRVILSGWGGDEAVSSPINHYFAEFIMNGQWPELRNAIRLRLATAGESAPLLKARKLHGILDGIIMPRLPDFLYALTGRNMWLEHHAPCIQPSFARLYRHQVKDLRGPAWRTPLTVRATIRHLLEYGHLTPRLEDWAGSGAHHRLEYRYPMLDKRLVEFVLGVPTSQFCGADQNRSLFRRALGVVLPSAGDWTLPKTTPTSLAEFRKEHFEAHSEWAHHLLSDAAVSPATRFVDPGRIRKAVQSHRNSDRPSDLRGVREAFGCYAIKLGL